MIGTTRQKLKILAAHRCLFSVNALTFYFEVDQQHGGGGEEAIEAEKFPASAFQPAGQPFKRQQAGEKTEDHPDQTRHKQMRHGTWSA
jgi:hypothetical protein